MRRILIALTLSLFAAPAGAQQTLDGLDAEIADATRAHSDAAAQRDRVGAEVTGLVEQRENARRRLRDRVEALYRLRRAGLLPLAGGFDALLRHTARIERLERMVGRDLDALNVLEQRVTALSEERARLSTAVETHERELGDLRARRDALERATIGLWAGIAPPEAAADGFGMRLSDGSSFAARFSDLRGRLAMPVGGTTQIRAGEREGGAGVEIAAAVGAPVRAVAAGRVAYAAPHPAYGQLVIIDHGEGFYTVYGGLEASSVAVHQPVEANALLGTTGAQAMFFQVRQGTRPLSAREWLGI